MATLAEVARSRRADLRVLLKASRKVDAAQEAMEREVKRLSTRKNALPELGDAERILKLAQTIDAEMASFVGTLTALGQKWRSV